MRDTPEGFRMLISGVALQSVGSGMTMPYLVIYLHLVRHIPLPIVGLIAGTGAVISLGAAALGGRWIDRVGAGQIMMVTGFVGAVASLALSGVHSVWQSFGAVMLLYVAAGTFWPSQQALVGGLRVRGGSERLFAWSFLALNAGLGVGGLVGATLVTLAHPASFVLAYRLASAILGLGGVVVLVSVRRLPATVRHTSAERPGGSYRQVLRDRRFLVMLAVELALLMGGYLQLSGGWQAFAVIDVGAAARVLGLALAANTAVIVVAQMPVQRLLRGWRRSRQLVLAGLVWSTAWLASLGAVLVRHDREVAALLLIVCLGVFGLGETVFSPVMPAIVNLLATEESRGRYNAASSALWSVGEFVATPVATLVIATGNRYAWILGVLAWIGLATLVAGIAAPRALGRELDLGQGEPVD